MVETEREISAKYSEGDLSLQNTMRAILVHTCARELIEMLDWRKFFGILIFVISKNWVLILINIFSEKMPLHSSITKGRNGA